MARMISQAHDLPMNTRQVVLTVVENEGRYLMIRETHHHQLWYLPAGKVEMGEDVLHAAIRETREEAGIDVVPIELLVLQHDIRPGPIEVLRFVIVAKARGSLVPKSAPDEHSLEARWCTPAEIEQLDLRHDEVLDHVRAHRKRVALR
jgi:phosphatase NudJ